MWYFSYSDGGLFCLVFFFFQMVELKWYVTLDLKRLSVQARIRLLMNDDGGGFNKF